MTSEYSVRISLSCSSIDSISPYIRCSGSGPSFVYCLTEPAVREPFPSDIQLCIPCVLVDKRLSRRHVRPHEHCGHVARHPPVLDFHLF